MVDPKALVNGVIDAIAAGGGSEAEQAVMVSQIGKALLVFAASPSALRGRDKVRGGWDKHIARVSARNLSGR